MEQKNIIKVFNQSSTTGGDFYIQKSSCTNIFDAKYHITADKKNYSSDPGCIQIYKEVDVYGITMRKIAYDVACDISGVDSPYLTSLIETIISIIHDNSEIISIIHTKINKYHFLNGIIIDDYIIQHDYVKENDNINYDCLSILSSMTIMYNGGDALYIRADKSVKSIEKTITEKFKEMVCNKLCKAFSKAYKEPAEGNIIKDFRRVHSSDSVNYGVVWSSYITLKKSTSEHKYKSTLKLESTEHTYSAIMYMDDDSAICNIKSNSYSTRDSFLSPGCRKHMDRNIDTYYSTTNLPRYITKEAYIEANYMEIIEEEYKKIYTENINKAKLLSEIAKEIICDVSYYIKNKLILKVSDDIRILSKQMENVYGHLDKMQDKIDSLASLKLKQDYTDSYNTIKAYEH